MASKLQQISSKACQVTQYVTKNTSSIYKQTLESNKQYIVEPPTMEKCDELSKKLFYTRLASIPGRYEAFWKELDGVKNLWNQRKELKVEDAGIAALFGIECFAWFCAGRLLEEALLSLVTMSEKLTSLAKNVIARNESFLNDRVM